MSAIGKTKLDDNEDISALLGQQMKTDKPAEKMIENISEPEQTKAVSKDNDKLKHNRSAKFTDSEAEQLDKIMLALGTDKVSKALRWCLQKIWETQGEEIEKIAAEKKRIGSL
jgi:hypothetical protein